MNDLEGKIVHLLLAGEIGFTLINVVPTEKLMEEAVRFAEKLAALPRLAMQASKMLINRSMELDWASGL